MKTSDSKPAPTRAGRGKIKKTTIKIVMTRDEAKSLGLLTCACGHPENNHFDHGKKPCAHCPCGKYDERSRVGHVVKNHD